MSESGQASVEMLGAIPLLLAVALAVGQALALGGAREAAGTAAHAGALAAAQGADPVQAARASSPDAERAQVHVSGAKVTVAVRARRVFPGVGDKLVARATFAGAPR